MGQTEKIQSTPTSSTKERAEKAKRLYAVIEERRKLEKEETGLKDWAKLECGSIGVLEAGDIVITLENKSSSKLDKKALTKKFGEKVIQKFMVETSYQQVNVKMKG